MGISKYLSKLLVCIISVFVLSNVGYARSVYVITDHEDSDISAYEISGEWIDYQTQMDPPLDFGSGAIGLALEPCSWTLFTSYDGTPYKIGIIDAKTMTTIKDVDVSVEFAGLVFDAEKQRLLAVQREQFKLYVYLWNPTTKTITLEDGTPETLTNIDHAYGLALDEIDRILYVSDRTNQVKYYDADDPNFTYLGSIDITVDGNNRIAVGIDFYRDQQGNKYLYTGAWSHQASERHEYLVRTDITDINNLTFTEKPVVAFVLGITVDQDTGLVYVTTTNDHIEVYNNSTFPTDPCDTDSNDIIDGPADIIVRGDVSYKPPVLHIEKVDVNDPNSVLPEDYITYKITYGPNGFGDTNVIITDYLPYEVDPIDSEDPNYNSEKHTYTWQIGSLNANDPNDSVLLTVQVREISELQGIITNYCEIEGDEAFAFTTAVTNVGPWEPNSDIIYVDCLSPCNPGTGMSWKFACRDLQDALTRARAGNADADIKCKLS